MHRLAMISLLSVVAVVGSTAPASADPHLDANAADTKGDYAAELALLKPAAASGQVWAENNLGLLYAHGRGVARDDALAAFWFKKAADKGDQSAAMNLAGLYFSGRVKPEDPTQAAEMDKARSKLELASLQLDCYQKNDPQTCTKLQKSLLDGASTGDPEAELRLGDAYYFGLAGLPRDLGLSVAWTSKAANQNLKEAESKLALYYSIGTGVAQDDARALSWTEKAADQGDLLAQLSAAHSYEAGVGTRADPAKAFSWYLAAAKAGAEPAQEKVGAAYAFGHGVPRDDVQAYAWISIARDSTSTGERDAQTLVLQSVASRLTPHDLLKAQAIATQLKKEHHL
jgi:TPR repeat protein